MEYLVVNDAFDLVKPIAENGLTAKLKSRAELLLTIEDPNEDLKPLLRILEITLKQPAFAPMLWTVVKDNMQGYNKKISHI
jgi:hypothetical protein